jgi:hypothetical protein
MRKPGLWFSAMKAEVEDVTSRHKKECIGCGTLPSGRRLKVVRGTGRHQTVEIRCEACGSGWIMERVQEGRRAIGYLKGVTNVKSIRITKPKG